MALPDTITPRKFIPVGIDWQIQLADTRHRTRVQRAPDASGSPGTYQDVAVLGEGQSLFRDLRELGTKWWYRCRHEADDEDVSPYTTDFCQTAVVLDEERQTRDLSLPGATKIFNAGTINVVDAAGAASSITKEMRFGFADLTPIDETEPWGTSGGYLHPNSLATRTYLRSIPLAKGVTITGMRMRGYRNSASELCEVKLWQGSDTTYLSSTIVTLTHATTGWATTANTSLSQLVGDENYTAVIQLFSSVAVADARFLWLEVDYTMPSYDKAY